MVVLVESYETEVVKMNCPICTKPASARYTEEVV